MEAIYRIIGSLCVCGYITGVFLNLTSSADTKKVIQLVAVLYVFTRIVTSLGEIHIESDAGHLTDVTVLHRQAEEYIIDSAAKDIEQKIMNILDEKNISYNTVTVHIHKENEKYEIAQVFLAGIQSEDRHNVLKNLENITDRVNFGE